MNIIKTILRLPLFFMMMAAVSSCSVQDRESHLPELPDEADIHLAKIAEVRNVGDDYFSGLRRMMLTTNGDILLNDWQLQRIFRLDGDGELLEEIGRVGRGPGEFQSIYALVLEPADTLHVLDWNNARHQVFAEHEGRWKQVRERNVNLYFGEELYSPFPHEVFYDEGRKLALFRSNIGMNDTTSMYHQWVAEVDINLDPVDDIRLMLQPAREAVVIRTENSVMANSHPAGFQLFTWIDRKERTFHYLRNDEGIIRLMDMDGKLLREIQVPYEKVPFDEADKQSYLSDMRNYYGRDTQELAASRFLPWSPFIRQMVVDDKGRYWLDVSRKDPVKPNWLILDRDGSLVGSFLLKDDLETGTMTHIHAVRGNRVYAFGFREYEPMLIVYQKD